MNPKKVKMAGWKYSRTFFLSPYLLVVPVTALIIILLPGFFPSYIAKPEDSGLIDKKGGLEYYRDIDRDGASERIIYFNNTQNQASLKIIEEDGEIGEHYYFRGKVIPKYSAVSFGTVTPDSGSLIFVYSRSSDSIFLNVVDYKQKGESHITTRLIARIEHMNDCQDMVLMEPHCTDMDGDGYNDFVGGILAGFSLQPRRCFIYDLRKDSLMFSPATGVWFDLSGLVDINGDGRKEIITSTYSIGNFPDSAASLANDHAAWIMAFDSRFHYLFNPVKYEGKYVRVVTKPVFAGKKPLLVTLIYQTAPGAVEPTLALIDTNGTIIREKRLHGRGMTFHILPGEEANGEFFLIRQSGMVERINSRLETIGSKQIKEKKLSLMKDDDYDGDGKVEHLCATGSSSQFTLYREDFSEPVILNIPLIKCSVNTGKKVDKDGRPLLFIQQEDRFYLFAYGSNPWYFLKYAVFLGIYLVLLSVILLSQYVQRRIFSQRYEAEKQILALQLEFFKKQLDPHFAYNVLNLVGVTLKNKDSDTAYKNIIKLSTLIRSSIASSGNLARSLAEELNFTSAYLELVKVSLEDNLQFEIRIAPGVDLTVKIPRMVVQTHAENAVKHGIRPKPGGGFVLVDVSTREDRLVILIEDNGIGRKQAAEKSMGSTGKGTEMMEAFFNLFNKFNKQKILYTITDLFTDQNEACGTRVTLSIPLKYKYHLFPNA